MDAVHQARLGRIVRGEVPAGSGEARTLGIMLLAEVLVELRAIRASLGKPDEPAAPPAADPGDILSGRLSDVRRAIAACDNAGVLARCIEVENLKKRPRSTVLSALRSRIQTLA